MVIKLPIEQVKWQFPRIWVVVISIKLRNGTIEKGISAESRLSGKQTLHAVFYLKISEEQKASRLYDKESVELCQHAALQLH